MAELMWMTHKNFVSCHNLIYVAMLIADFHFFHIANALLYNCLVFTHGSFDEVGKVSVGINKQYDLKSTAIGKTNLFKHLIFGENLSSSSRALA